MPNDPDILRDNLRRDTARLLGIDLQNITPAQEVRLSHACMLRLELSDIEERKLNNQTFDVKAYIIISEALETLLGGDPAAPRTVTHDFDGAFEALSRLLSDRSDRL